MTRSPAGCSTKDTTKVVQDTWTYNIGQGEATRHEMEMCRRHARQVPAGYEGRNFRVIEHRSY